MALETKDSTTVFIYNKKYLLLGRESLKNIVPQSEIFFSFNFGNTRYDVRIINIRATNYFCITNTNNDGIHIRYIYSFTQAIKTLPKTVWKKYKNYQIWSYIIDILK